MNAKEALSGQVLIPLRFSGMRERDSDARERVKKPRGLGSGEIDKGGSAASL